MSDPQELNLTVERDGKQYDIYIQLYDFGNRRKFRETYVKHWFSKSAWLLAGSLLCVPGAIANEFSASFKGTDIQEFINI
ncbi:hypothetical protein OFC57_39165, partial [Escherichia coli]|nr:hypothetical protein [Escherichia coli]